MGPKYLQVFIVLSGMQIWSSAVVAGPSLVQGILGAQGSCMEHNSSWTPHWTNLVGYWKLNEASGASAVTDSSITGATGSAVSGDGDFGKNGNMGSSYFSNTSGLITTGTDPAQKPNFPMTVATWIYSPTYQSNASTIYSNDIFSNSGGNRCGINVTVDNLTNQLIAQTGDCGGELVGNRYTSVSVETMPTGQWNHVVAVFPSFGVFKIYLNGKELTLNYEGGATSMNYSTGPSQPGRIGGSNATQRHFTGYIDEVTLWDVALSLAEVRKIHNQQNCSKRSSNAKRQIIIVGTAWTVPADWNNSNNKIEVIGAGGGGGGGTSTLPGAGGGGGAYSRVNNVTLTPSSTVTVAIGAAGAAGTAGASGSAGGDTYLCNSSSNCATIGGTAVVAGAKGGSGGRGGSTGAGGNGGTVGTGVGGTKAPGGNGGAVATNPRTGGGGGGAAGRYGSGGNGGSYTTDTTNTIGGAGGGGNGGGGDAANVADQSSNGSNGGTNRQSTAGGIGSSSVATPGGNGVNGSGPGGGSGATTTGTASLGGQASNGVEWDMLFGSGSGGAGGAGGISGASARPGQAGGLYGGGGGGGGRDTSTNRSGGAGSQGVIIISYTP